VHRSVVSDLQQGRWTTTTTTNICFVRPEGYGYNRTLSRLLHGAHRIIPDGARPVIQDHQASHPGMCEKGLSPPTERGRAVSTAVATSQALSQCLRNPPN